MSKQNPVPLMDVQAPHVADKRHPVMVHTDTKDRLSALATEYNCNLNFVIMALLDYYEATK